MNKDKVAIFILAAGKGSRMRPVTFFLPKPLIPISLNRRLISWVIDMGIQSGFPTYVLVRQKQAKIFAKMIGRNNVTIISSPHDRETGGEILNHHNLLINGLYKYVVVVPADYFIKSFQLKSLIRHLESIEGDIAVVGCNMRACGEYLATDDTGLIKEIRREKTNISAVGIYALRTSILKENLDLREKKIHTTDLLNIFIKRGYKAYIFDFAGEWNDLGTWSRYFRFIFRNIFQIKFSPT